ncbi:unnamed protein product [Prunus armeniaca]
MRHQTLSSLTEGREARRSMSTVSLMLWDHMLVIIISNFESFPKALPIGLIRGIQHWHHALFAPGKILARKFCKKYFQHEERVTTTQLNNTRQKHGEDPVNFVC